MFIKLIRLGKDAELKSLQGGKQVLNFSGAYSVGFGDKEKTQWIDCAIWGDRASAVQQYLIKGAQIVIYGEDLEVEAWNKNDAERTAGATLKCTVRSFDFAGGKSEGSSPIAAPAPQAAPMAAPAAPQAIPQAVNYAQDLLNYQQCATPEASQAMWATFNPQQQAFVAEALS